MFMNYELNKSKREQKPLTVLLFDLDNFKDVNDALDIQWEIDC